MPAIKWTKCVKQTKIITIQTTPFEVKMNDKNFVKTEIEINTLTKLKPYYLTIMSNTNATTNNNIKIRYNTNPISFDILKMIT